MKIKFFTLILLGTTLSLHSFAGDKEGNGGGSIVCANSDGTLSSAKLLDLRDAEKKDLTIVRSEIPKEIQLERALRKLWTSAPDLEAKMRIILNTLDSKTVPLASGKRLAPPTDTDLKQLDEPRNCSLEGVANYDDFTDTLTVDPIIVEKMSQTDQAALKFHEALYKVWRKGSTLVSDSVQVRNLTGRVFASQPLIVISPTVGVERASYLCENQDNRFFVIPDKNGRVRLQFTKIDAQEMMERTYVDVQHSEQFSSRLSQVLSTTDVISSVEDPGMKVTKFSVETTSELQPPYHLILSEVIQFLSSPKLKPGDHFIDDSIHMNTAACADDYDSDDSKLQCRKI